jgi:PhzF family phenazine biosynthesis protein
MELPIYQVDAFASKVFAGNPAAVCPLDKWLPDDTLQSIARENNLSETAFLVRSNGRYQLRWFTPGCEVDLCGHATLASAYVLFTELGESRPAIPFDTHSGELLVTRNGDRLSLNFPSRPPAPVSAHPALTTALGGPEPLEILGARDYLVRYETEEQVRNLSPNMEQLKTVDRFAVIVTAPGTDCDFVSRFFAPAKGVNEDPVTGSAHCTLIPYWAEKLSKTTLFARQVSPRGGELFCELKGDRVEIAGRAIPFLKGTIYL